MIMNTERIKKETQIIKNHSTIFGLIFSIFALIILCCALNAKSAKAATPSSQSNSGKKVLDLGELEVEGEVRRPPVDWIDSNKRMKQQIPGLYANQFRKLEEELLRPIAKERAQKILEVKPHVRH
jgi:hypothetical protein